LAFTLLLLSGYYVPEIRSRNLDADWPYRKLGGFAYAALDKGLNGFNTRCESLVKHTANVSAAVFKDLAANVALFFSVNIWLLAGLSGKRLEIRKHRLYHDIMEGTLPIGIGAAVAISFIFLVFLLT
ncbi:MAG: hypothetical protein K9J83_02235, partial [Desulfarculaceae bacterium]|nr:hypothetical protein [Desulfarculaceae bacterium]